MVLHVACFCDFAQGVANAVADYQLPDFLAGVLQ